jgi:hypothetical protein
VIDSKKAVLNSSGQGIFIFTNIFNDAPYYIQLQHRNSIETWSSSPGQMFSGNSLTYNFTNAQSKAFGNNQILVDNSPVSYAIFSGDVDQNDAVNLADIVEIYNDAGSFITGYIPTDVNGDNVTELSDMIIAYNNSAAFAIVISP